MIVTFAWTEIAAITSILVVVSAIALTLAKQFMRGTFTTRETHAELALRVHAVELVLKHVPTRDDLRAVEHRLAGVEVAVSTVREGQSRVEEATAGVRRVADLLLRHQLGEKPGEFR
jgi:hypothetical protein